VFGKTKNKSEGLFTASQWQLMTWRFSRHRVAVVSLVVLVIFYLIAAFCEFVAPYDPGRYSAKYVLAPPTTLHFVSPEGKFSLRPYVFGLESARDMETLAVVFEVDESQVYPIKFLVHGDPYKLWGLWESDIHLFGVDGEDGMLFLWGADSMGRDLFSRVVFGARISLSIGLVGVFLSLVLGVILGGISGYFGGAVDVVIQRVIEFLRSLPAIPLWMTLAAALPHGWSPIRLYFAITVLLSLIGWTGLARVVRGRFMSLREEDFVMAARLCGASEMRVILRHLVPSFLSHLIASLTLSIPGMILSETSLSFLGLGLQPPVVSWGVLLQTAQNLRTVVLAPWLLLPGLAVVIVVLAFNFVGDGMRDAADPYSH
jgi:peptide/nickel transport system permease protein